MDVYFIAWLVFAFIYSVLAAFTRIFYFRKSVTQLNSYEYKINRGQASIFDRATFFVYNLLACLIFPPIYILALVFGSLYIFIF